MGLKFLALKSPQAWSLNPTPINGKYTMVAGVGGYNVVGGAVMEGPKSLVAGVIPTTYST